MKKIVTTISIFTIVMAIAGFAIAEKTTYKCMIQMKNYEGLGAYISVSLLNPAGDYVKTLRVIGEDDEWYATVKNWWAFQKDSNQNIDGITGATISGGQRSMMSFAIEDQYINAGYKLRFESAVEDQPYYESDVEFELTTASVKGKTDGTGFIRYVRLIPRK